MIRKFIPEPDIDLVVWALNAFSGSNYTRDDVVKAGMAYALTELTDEEAKELGARAYLKYVGPKREGDLQ